MSAPLSADDPFVALAAPLRAQWPAGARVAVAVSGGADSAMLAVAAASLGRDLVLFHVHHGLQAPADDWQAQVEALAGALGVPLHSARVAVAPDGGKGIEAAARAARYAALAGLAREAGVRYVMLAHHRNDQAETVLLRLLRGAGPQGMGAMRPATTRDGIVYLRPWLDLDRARILAAAAAYAARTGWHAVQDPTNTDPAYTRAAVRTRLTPVLDARWPGWQAVVARQARHMAEAAEILAEVAESDFAALGATPDGRDFDLAAWRALSPPRQAQVLRYWLGLHGLRAPADARLAELMRQLRGLHQLGHDRDLRQAHEGHWIRCHRGRVWLEPQGG
ncbi:tRNA lysidine(34) synthetase TilS [Bordetella genomosp. 1]|uniref:tRNA(Ile)-lysidine synthase n=1 Tax=Bordetella genomosp. 1 TaxID=1395607 RepID=A0A261S7Q7_9BORD|nr:tRNA lysidine(34) synthetase TilS [Bordetella genomosp. 1]OZI32992.1 tRNA lysidine(34) synthetase TilS [Bordetella genomosp. 1]